MFLLLSWLTSQLRSSNNPFMCLILYFGKYIYHIMDIKKHYFHIFKDIGIHLQSFFILFRQCLKVIFYYEFCFLIIVKYLYLKYYYFRILPCKKSEKIWKIKTQFLILQCMQVILKGTERFKVLWAVIFQLYEKSVQARTWTRDHCLSFKCCANWAFLDKTAGRNSLSWQNIWSIIGNNSREYPYQKVDWVNCPRQTRPG